MTLRLRTTPRKLPRQDRARETVDAMLEATARTLLRVGYDRASTNRIALEAGVSVGSLYQYFPNKEALVAALIDRHVEQMTELCREALVRCSGLPLEAAVSETVRVMVAVHAINPKLHCVLQEQVPRVGRLKRLDDLHAEAMKLVQTQLESRAHEIRPKDLELAAFFVVTTVDALLHSTLAKTSNEWGEEQIVGEITDLVVGYLKGPCT